MLSFTTASLFLGGLVATAVPVLLHLLMQGKPKVIEFPAVMFILQKIETHRRNYRLKHILLLATRILLFTLLGLALAGPMVKLSWFSAGNQDGFMSQFVTSFASQDAPIAAAIVIDSSLRMNYIAKSKTRLEEAQEFARWILRQIPQNSSVAILSCEPEAPVFQVDKLAAEDKVNRLRMTPLGRPVAEMVQGAAALLSESDFEYRELYVLSDLSVPGWDIPISSETLRRYNGRLFLVDVSVKEPTNSSLQRMTLIPETPIAPSPVQIDVQVTHTGSAISKTIELILIGTPSDPTAEVVRMSRTVDFSDGESQLPISMVLTGIESGIHQGKLRFATSDALPIDDQCWFTLSMQPPQKILVFAQPPVNDSATYLRSALVTVPFAVDTKPIAMLAGMTMSELQEYQAVMLLDPSSLMSNTWKKLADYAFAGHGVGIFLGPHADYSLPSFNHSNATEVLGAKLVRQAINPDGNLWIIPGISPIFTPFRTIDMDLRNFQWDAQAVYRYWEVGELSSQADIAARFSDHRPAIITQTLGRGCSAMVATPFSETSDKVTLWNDLMRGDATWMFMLLAEGIAKHLVGMGTQKSNFSIGESVVLRPDMPTLPASCLLGTPQGTSERLTPDPVRREIVIPTTTDPGNYSVRSGGVGQSALNMGFSANLPMGETRLQRVDKATLDRLFGTDAYQVVRTPQEIEHGTARRRVGQDIYGAVMLLLACIFAVEYVFANRIYKSG